MSSRWISREDVMAVTGWHLRTLQRKAQKGDRNGRRLQVRHWLTGTGGRPIPEYRLDSLPLPAQLKLLERRKSASAEAATALCPAAADEQPAVQSTSGTLPKVKLSTGEEAAARARYRVIEPLINFENEQRHAGAPGQLHLDLGLLLPDGRKVLSASTMAQYLAHTHQRSERTIWRYYGAFQKAGLLGLARRTREDKGKSRFFEQHPKAATLAAYLYLTQRQSVRAAFEAIHRDHPKLGIEPGELPTYETVRSFLNGSAFSQPMKILAREGSRAYRERCSPYLSRTRLNVTAGEIWVGDHMIHDVEVQNDVFLDAEWGAPIRLRFTAFADFRSNYFMGYSWCWEGSSHSIVTALRRGIERYGPPEAIYCDNGKDYLKVAKGAMPAYLRESPLAQVDWHEKQYTSMAEVGVFRRLGISVQHCIVRHPQSKHVERLFHIVHSGLDKIFPTYTGGSPAMRPDFATEAMAKHRKLLRIGLPGMSSHPRASVFIRMATAWIEDVYHNKKTKARDMEGLTPRQAFETFRNPLQKPAPPPEVLALMLAEHRRRWVRECSVMLEKRRYSANANDQDSARVLHEMNGREVLVAYDPGDLENVAILDLEGRLIGWARHENYVRQSSDADTGARIAESMQQRRRLEKHTRQAIVGIGERARANGAVTEVEHLAMRAGLMVSGEVVTQTHRRRLRASNTAVAPATADEIGRMLAAEEGEDVVAQAVTQRPLLRRSGSRAEAPPSAAEIAKRAIAMEDED